jgi:hypothetical protein
MAKKKIYEVIVKILTKASSYEEAMEAVGEAVEFSGILGEPSIVDFSIIEEEDKFEEGECEENENDYGENEKPFGHRGYNLDY